MVRIESGFQWKKSVMASTLIFLWTAPLLHNFPNLNVYGKFIYFIGLYGLTLFISRKNSAPASGIISVAGLLAATIVTLTIMALINVYLPFPPPWPWLPKIAKFLYFLYPGIFSAIVTTAVLFYPLNKFFGESSRFCAWSVVGINFLFRHSVILHGGNWLSQLISITEASSLIMVWFLASRIQKSGLRFSILSNKIQHRKLP